MKTFLKSILFGQLLVLVFLFSGLKQSNACSAFTLEMGRNILAAKSYDWHVGLGIILSNPRGERLSIPTGIDSPISWDARFGSLTFNQYGQYLPNGGINEAGLVIEVLWLEETYYPVDARKIPINELQWVQYHLDVSSSVEEVISSSKNFIISPMFGKLHYFVADKSGNTAIIEFINGETVIHTGEGLVCRAITNDTYANSIGYLNKNEVHGGNNASLNRFKRLAENIEKTEQSSTRSPRRDDIADKAFELLKNVWIEGWTKWNIVYDLNRGQIHYFTDVSMSTKKIDIRQFDFSPNAVPLFVDMNNFFRGEINDQFVPFATDNNAELMLNSIQQTGVPLSADEIELISAYPKNREEIEKGMKERVATHGILVIKINNLKKNGGIVNIGLFDSEEGFDNQRPINGGIIRGSKDTLTYVFYNVPLGKDYAIGFYHDENSNGRMDTNFLGIPREPYGFSGRGRKFDTAKFLFDEQKKVVYVRPR